MTHEPERSQPACLWWKRSRAAFAPRAPAWVQQDSRYGLLQEGSRAAVRAVVRWVLERREFCRAELAARARRARQVRSSTTCCANVVVMRLTEAT
jgi:hypothetical protein